MQVLFKFSCLSITLLLGACQGYNPVILTASNHRLDNPEVNSQPFKVNIATALSSRTALTVEENASNDDGAKSELSQQVAMTTGKGVEVKIRADTQEAIHLGIKYQFYGDHAESSSTGNFSQALTLGYEFNNDSDDSSCSTSFCDENESYSNWEYDTHAYDLAWILGYKLTSYNIVYGGPFYRWISLDGYKSIADLSEQNISGDGDMIGANIAIEHRFKFGLGLTGEIAYSTLRWEKYSIDDTGYHFKIDYQF